MDTSLFSTAAESFEYVYYQESLESLIQVMSPSLPASVGLRLLHNLAAVLQAKCKFEDAAALYDAVLRGLNSPSSDYAYDSACAINNLAQIHATRCDYVNAEKLSKLSLQILESASEPDVELLALIQSNIGRVLQEQCKYEEAEIFHLKSIANLNSLKEPSVHSYIVQNNRGMFFQKSGNFVDALNCYNAALDSIETGNQYYPIILSNIGTITELGGNTAAAAEYYNCWKSEVGEKTNIRLKRTRA